MDLDPEEQQSYDENYHHSFGIKQLLPANPIYQKPVKQSPRPTLKVEIIKNQNLGRQSLRPVFKKAADEPEVQDAEQYENESAFNKYYSNNKCIYLKYNNKEYNYLNGTQYYSSTFIEKQFYNTNKQSLNNIKQLLKQSSTSDLLQSPQKNMKHQVKFSSNFQSGNLFSVFQKNVYEYDLILQNDINSKGNTQWFYFSVTNLPKDIQITFNIVNLLKSDSLFNYGMQPVVFSKIKNQKDGEGWTRSGKSINYFKNDIKKQKSKRFYHTLTFKIVSKFGNDTLYIAHCFPYTYTKLNEYINDLIKIQKKGSFIKSVLGKSLGNNNIELLTVTEPLDKKKDNRKVILIMARQHPGETQGSYVCQGIINFLTSKCKQTQFIKKNYIVKIIPMVNPDGVIFGNYRSNLMGCDLNRKWDIFDKQEFFPQVTCIKSYINQLSKVKKLKFILDLHGHSKKLNSFFYGNPFPQHPEVVRAFPYVCCKLNDQISYDDCTFSIQQMKKRAARVYLSLTHQLINVYTFQSSFYGYTKENKKYPFGIEQYKNLGTTLCQGLYSFLEYDYYMQMKAPQKCIGIYSKSLQHLKQDPNLILVGGTNFSGSQTNPQQYQTVVNELPSLLIHSTKSLIKSEFEINNKLEQKQKKSSITQKKQSSIKNNSKIPVRQRSKNLKQFRLFQINRVDSILPDKYQMALQPMATIGTPKQKQKQILQKIQSQRKKLLKRSIRQYRVSIHTQTINLSQQVWDTFKPILVTYVQSEDTQIQYRPFNFYRDNFDLKYVSLISSQKKDKKYSLKLDLINRIPLTNLLKNTYTQTVLSSMKIDRNKSISNLPQIDQKQIKNIEKLKMQILKTSRLIGRRDNQDVFSEMIKKYLMQIKQRNLRTFKPDDSSYIEKSLPTKIEETVDRPFSIKKQILHKKKINAPKKN